MSDKLLGNGKRRYFPISAEKRQYTGQSRVGSLRRRVLYNAKICSDRGFISSFRPSCPYSGHSIFGGEFRAGVKAMGIQEVLSTPRSPRQRAYVERVIGTIRRECLDHVI